MWSEVNGYDRHQFLSKSDNCFIPGLRSDPFEEQIKLLKESRYTGHCPMLKFRYGRCYGDNTRQILKELRTQQLSRSRTGPYRPQCGAPELPPEPDRRPTYADRARRYVTGYTGYVPGLNFRYGKPYGQAADDSMEDFEERQRDLRRRVELDSRLRARSAPRMESIHSRDEIRRQLHKMDEFRDINRFTDPDHTISPEFPPIAGYTGHIPRIKGTEASLSQRYACAARRGLQAIRTERHHATSLQEADSRVKAVLREAGKRHSYWNWG